MQNIIAIEEVIIAPTFRICVIQEVALRLCCAKRTIDEVLLVFYS